MSDLVSPERLEKLGITVDDLCPDDVSQEDFGVRWKPRMIGGRYDPIGRPVIIRGKGQAAPICGAKLRSGRPCRKLACYTTKGEWGRCYVHGGAISIKYRTSLDRAVRPETVARRLINRMNELARDEGMAAIESQVALAAAALEEFLRNLEREGDMVIDEGKIVTLIQLAEKLTKMTERRHKVREGQLVRVQYQFMDTMAQVVVKVVDDALRKHLSEYPDLWEKIVKDISNSLKAFSAEEAAG